MERRPTVEIGDVVPGATDGYFLPVTNHGPCDAKIYCVVNRVQHVEADKSKSTSPADCYIRWQGGKGNWPEGNPNWQNFKEGETKRLHVMEATGFVTLPNKEEGRAVRVLHANSQSNIEFHATIGSNVELEIQAFGNPNLAKVTMRNVMITVLGRGE